MTDSTYTKDPAIDYVIAVCAMMSQALAQAQQYAQQKDFDAYERELNSAIEDLEKIDPEAAVIAGIFIAKISDAAEQILFTGMSQTELTKLIDFVDDHMAPADLESMSIDDIRQQYQSHKNNQTDAN